jgi:hypothetical protein
MKFFIAVLAAKLAPSTTETVFAELRTLMQPAVDDGVIAANPCSRVPLPRAEARHRATSAPLKTKASKRTIPADDWMLTEVTAHMRAGPGRSS